MPRKLSATASDSFDLIRAVVAFAVMIGHLRTFCFRGFPALAFQILFPANPLFPHRFRPSGAPPAQ